MPLRVGVFVFKSVAGSHLKFILICLCFCQVTEKLHDRADKSAHDKEDFIDLANRVEEFTLRFLDSMKYDGPLREMFSRNPETTVILDTAIKLEQKKVMMISEALIKALGHDLKELFMIASRLHRPVDLSNDQLIHLVYVLLIKQPLLVFFI